MPQPDGPSTALPRDVVPAAIGLSAGFLSGLFGVGGGILLVPAFVAALRMDQRPAHGTSLAAIIPIAVAGVVGYGLDGAIDWVAASALVAGAATIGALLGTWLLSVVPRRGLAIAFAVVLISTALRLVVENGGPSGTHELSALGVLALVGVGVVAGTLAGLLGVGGGIVMVPAMVVAFGIPSAVAKGTSLAVIIPTALVGTRQNVRRGIADLRVAVVVGSTGVLSAFLAARLSLGLDDRLANRLFAGLLALVAIRLLLTQLRRDSGRP